MLRKCSPGGGGALFALALALALMGNPAQAADGSAGRGHAKSSPAAGAHFALEGPVRQRVDGVTKNWLLPATGANPAILAMFRDRDRAPYRDFLPWSGEFAGKYLTGGTEVLELTGDPALEAHLKRFVRELVALQDADGYLGPFPKGHRLTGSAPNVGEKGGPTWDAWGHYHAMLGLLAWHDRTQDPDALRAASKIGDLFCVRFLGSKAPRLVDTGSTEMNLAPAHSLLLLAEKTKEPRYRELALQIVEEFAAADPQGNPLAGDYLRRGLKGDHFYTLPKPRWESLHPILALAVLAKETGEERYRAAFENLWWSIVELDRHNNGGFTSGEQAQGNPYHKGAIETCCTIAWLAMTVEMLELTGDSRAADELELSTLNSGIGLFNPSGRWSTYDTPMDGVRKANFHDIVFQARPGSPELNCCSVNAARGFGLISRWALQQDEGGLFLNWYGPGIMSAERPGGKITLKQETDYPRGGAIKIVVGLEKPETFSIRLRNPHWSTGTRIAVNGEPVSGIERGRYVDIKREWKDGDAIDLALTMELHAWAGERESDGLASLYRGPILLTCDRRWNPELPADPPAIVARGGEAPLAEAPAGSDAWILVDLPTEDGRTIRLCDFANAGADGSAYRSWLRAKDCPRTPFDRAHPWRSAPFPASK